MDGGFTVSNANRFLNTGSIEGKSFSAAQSETFGSSEVTGKSFADTLKEAVATVNALQKNADVQAQNLATGRTDNVADVMIASEKADIALKLMVQVRNKIIDAYQEIMRMQV
jgi:flagellar hook-basal body complex protein FliE